MRLSGGGGGGGSSTTDPTPKKSIWKSIGNFFSNLFRGGKKNNGTIKISRTGVPGILTTGTVTFDGYVTGAATTETAGTAVAGTALTGALTLGGILIPTMIGEPQFDWTRQFDGSLDIPISVDISRGDNNRNGIMLYRGVSSFAHTETQAIMYNEALFGIAIPNGLRLGETAHWDMDDHAMGDNYSVFTSWTTSKGTAEYFATAMGKAPGVVLSKRFKIGVNAIPNVSATGKQMQENEWLIFGPVIRANVQHVRP